MSISARPNPLRPRKLLDDDALGTIMVARGWIKPCDVDAIKTEQRQTRQTFGHTAASLGMINPAQCAEAQAELFGVGHADLERDPPDPKLIDPAMIDLYLAHRMLPWRRVGRLTAFVTARPELAEPALVTLRQDEGIAVLMVTDGPAMDQALTDLLALELADKATRRAPWSSSVRSMAPHRLGLAMGLLGAVACAVAEPTFALACLGFAILFLSLATTFARIASLLASRKADPPKQAPVEGTIDLAQHRGLPSVTLLIPLYREAALVPQIVSNLQDLHYPRGLLDVKILLERNDTETQEAARSADLPAWITALIVPDGSPKTKPRAMNVALDFCDSEIVGVFDAEDKPDPDQVMTIATLFRTAPTDVACIQCQLSYFNIRENWLSRCFQIEYSLWFDVLLRGWQRLGMPVPLGGTSVYFRRSVLVASGGWDAHNVTEDADLGMRLARKGFKTWLASSTTYEEANCKFLPWIRQRSRWLKGYMLTWLSHMRRPAALWRDLGPAGFLGFQVLFLGGAASYLAMPLLWAALTMTVVLGQSVYGTAMPGWALWALGVSLVTGQAVMLVSAVLALARRRMVGLIWWVPSLLLYWTMGAAAAWKAVIEVIVAPYYWDKTQHGVSRMVAAPMLPENQSQT